MNSKHTPRTALSGAFTRLGLLLCVVTALGACSSSDDSLPAAPGNTPAVPSSDDDSPAAPDNTPTSPSSVDDSPAAPGNTPTVPSSDDDSPAAPDNTPASPSGDDDPSAAPDNTESPDRSSMLAFVATRAVDFSAGRTDRISLDGDTVSGSYAATGSDIRVTTDGQSVYQIGRFALDNVTKYDIEDTAIPVYQYSLTDQDAVEGEGANPYTIVFVNDSKAYVIRYGSPRIWIINPSAQSQDELKIGEINIGAYDTDITPEANGAVLAGGKLFVLMERLERPTFAVNKVGYVAVFDTATDEEIDTGMGTADGLKGIPLGVQNPTAIQYSASDDMIYLIGRGNNFAEAVEGLERYTGGVEGIDPDTYTRETILDDGTEADNQGFINDLLVVNGTRAYVTTTASFASNSLRSMNPVTGLLDDAIVAELSSTDITTTALDPLNRVWVGLGGDLPGFRLLNAADGTDLGVFVNTDLVPINAVFIQRPVVESGQ